MCSEVQCTFLRRILHREYRENGKKKFPVRDNTGNLEMLPKHREFGLLKL